MSCNGSYRSGYVQSMSSLRFVIKSTKTFMSCESATFDLPLSLTGAVLCFMIIHMSCSGSYGSVHVMSTKTSRLVPWFIPSTTTSLLCLWETGAPQRLHPLEGSCDMSDSWLSLPKPSCHVWFMIKSTKTFMSWKVYSLFQVCVCVCVLLIGC